MHFTYFFRRPEHLLSQLGAGGCCLPCLIRQCVIWIRIRPDPDSGSRLLSNGDFLDQGYICAKHVVKIRSLSPRRY